MQLSKAQKKLFGKETIPDIYPEIYLIKVNQFDDIAKDSLDEWIYFYIRKERAANVTFIPKYKLSPCLPTETADRLCLSFSPKK